MTPPKTELSFLWTNFWDTAVPRRRIVWVTGNTPADLAWEDWIDKVETKSGRDIPNLDSAYIAHRNGVTASDYALEVVARAGEFS
jgi:hypothetical protein